ncbi:MAG: hypothetical protein NTU53_10015 [Planctomycetota bacterium]|nr:hypothetical protein [Planctomycetota bacterium]
MFRIEQSFQHAQIPPLTTEDIEAVLSFKTEGIREQYRQNGLADFPLTYGEDYAAFQVTVLRTAGGSLAIFRLVKKPTL